MKFILQSTGETMTHEIFKTDILVIGMGAAGQLAALYAYDANPDLNITIVTKALKGKDGGSRLCDGCRYCRPDRDRE